MDEILKNILKNHLSPFLRSHGFKRRGNRFYRKNGDFTITFALAVDREYTDSGAFFFFLCGVYSDQLAQLLGEEIKQFPDGYDHIFNHSILEINGEKEEEFHANKNGENDETVQKIKEYLQKTLDFVAKLKTLDDLMDYCLENNQLVHHQEIMRYLAIVKDETRQKAYLVTIKEKLHQNADRAYSFYAAKMEEYKELHL
jgi:Mg2+ and Co2+ transporter CorA